MHITQIGGQPFSDELFLRYCPNGHRGQDVTIAFEKSRVSLSIPLLSPQTIVTNTTDYAAKAKGASVEAVRLHDLVEELGGLETRSVLLLRRQRHTDGPYVVADATSRQDFTGRLGDLEEFFTKFPAEFLIDPQSYLRVERRVRDIRAVWSCRLYAEPEELIYTQTIKALTS